MGMNGNYSAGVLEDIAHYKPAARRWMMENSNTAHNNA
jgi:hypothetical protein